MEDPVVKGFPERTGVRSAHDLLTPRRGGLGEVPDTSSDELARRILGRYGRGGPASSLRLFFYRNAPQCPVRKGGGVAALGPKARLASARNDGGPFGCESVSHP